MLAPSAGHPHRRFRRRSLLSCRVILLFRTRLQPVERSNPPLVRQQALPIISAARFLLRSIPLVFASTAPGSVLTGTVTFAYGSPVTTIVVTFTVTFQSPTATLTSVSPASIPTSTTTGQTFTVTLVGTGFVASTDPTLKTKVGIITGQTGLAMTTDTNIAWVVKDTSNIILTITVPAATDSNLAVATPVHGREFPRDVWHL